MDTPHGAYHLSCIYPQHRSDTPCVNLARYARLRVLARAAVFAVRPCGRGCPDGWGGRVLASRGTGECGREGWKGERVGGQWGCRRVCESLGSSLALMRDGRSGRKRREPARGWTNVQYTYVSRDTVTPAFVPSRMTSTSKRLPRSAYVRISRWISASFRCVRLNTSARYHAPFNNNF